METDKKSLPLKVFRNDVILQIERLLQGQISREDIGWWAFDLLLEERLEMEPGHETLLKDVLNSLHYYHDCEPMAQQFYLDIDELLYYLKCLQGEEHYQRKKVIHWRV